MEDEGGEDGGGRGRFRPMGGDASHAGEPEWRMSDSTRRWKSEALMLEFAAKAEKRGPS